MDRSLEAAYSKGLKISIVARVPNSTALDVITHTYDIYASPSYRIPLSSKHNSKASTISPSFRFPPSTAKNQSLCVRLVWFATRDKFLFAFIEGRKKSAVITSNLYTCASSPVHPFTTLEIKGARGAKRGAQRKRRIYFRDLTLSLSRAAIFQSVGLLALSIPFWIITKKLEDWWHNWWPNNPVRHR